MHKLGERLKKQNFRNKKVTPVSVRTKKYIDVMRSPINIWKYWKTVSSKYSETDYEKNSKMPNNLYMFFNMKGGEEKEEKSNVHL